MTPNVFLSYSLADGDLVKNLKQSLARIGISAAETEPEIGSDWQEHLRTALKDSDAVIAILSPASSQSALVMQELGAAMMLDKPTVLVRSGESLVPFSLHHHRVIEATGLSPDQIALGIRESLAP